MNPFALLLILITAIAHTYWNFAIKRLIKEGGDHLLLLWLSTVIGTLLYLPIFIILLKFSGVTLKGLLFAALAGVFGAIYIFFLSKGYNYGDLSHVYTLSKTAPFFVLLISFFYLKETVTLSAFFGILLIVFGAYSIHLRNFNPKKDLLSPIISLKNKASIFALTTAITSAFIGLFSKLGAEALNPFVFVYAMDVFSIIFYVPFLLFKHKNIIKQFKKYKKTLIKTGFLDVGGYSLIVFTLSFTNLSYVYALRQISVVFSALLGYKILKESYGSTRLIASLIIFIGIFLISIS